MDKLFGIIPLILLLGLLLFLKKRHADNKLVSKLTNPTTIYILLITWTVFGFIATLDYTQQWGCISSHEPVFSIENIIYSGTALGLLSFGALIPKRQIGIVILVVELLFWLYKLFLVKGGYAVGFGGMPSINVLGFDTIALTLRLVLLKQVSRLPMRTIWILILVFFIMVIKVLFFP